MSIPKRVNKTKQEIAKEMAHRAKIEKDKALVRRIFPLLQTETIYDAQTALGAVAGYIKFDLAKKEGMLKVNDLLLDLSKEPESAITETMNAIKVELQDENARDVASLLERISNSFAQYGAAQYLKNPMKDLNVDEIVA